MKSIIIRKVTLLPAPFVGTTIRIRVADSLLFKLRSAKLADGRTAVTVEWGDGTSDVFDEDLNAAAHTYPAPGDYAIRISDDVRNFAIGVTADGTEYNTVYAPMVAEIVSNATCLTMLPGYAFNHCSNMIRFDVAGSNVGTISIAAFRKCVSLSGELSFPKVNAIQGTASILPFSGCTGITALHFAKGYEEVIKASAPYNADEGHTLGTGVKDVCRFDL